MGKRDKAAKAKASNGKSSLPSRSAAMPKRKGRGGSGGAYKAEDFQDLVMQLKPLGLSVLKMDADGNCLFRSVADQLCGDAEEHQSYRERCCAHMLDHAEEFSLFCVADDFESGCDSFESYVSKMERPGTWGSQLELMAICQSYGVNAIVHQSGLPSYEMVFSPEENQCMQISYHDGEHFNSVRFAWDMEGPVKHLSLAQLKGKSEKLKDLVEQVKYSLPPEHGFDDMLMRQVIVEAKEDVDFAVELLLKKMAKTEDPVAEGPEAKEPDVAVTSGSGFGYSEAAPPPSASVPGKPRAEKRQERKAKAEAKKKATKATKELKENGEPDQEAMKQLLCKQLLSV